MIVEIILLVLGLGLILYGANLLTDGASSIASNLGVSEFIIGLTIVAIGTSAPEFVVSVLSAAEGNSDVAVGNVLGSNLFNLFFILGVTAIITPVSLSSNNLRKDIPFGFLASVILLIVASDVFLDMTSQNVITRGEGLLMVCFFFVFMAYTFFSAKGQTVVPEETDAAKANCTPMWKSILYILAGLAGLIFGGNLFLDNAVLIASALGISESVIAITLMAGGTSLPELASCVVAAYRKKSQMALGNVVGSNISNIFLVLGASATVSPLSVGNILPADFIILVFSSLILFITAFSFRKREIDRIEGIIFVILYVVYITWLIMRS